MLWESRRSSKKQSNDPGNMKKTFDNGQTFTLYSPRHRRGMHRILFQKSGKGKLAENVDFNHNQRSLEGEG